MKEPFPTSNPLVACSNHAGRARNNKGLHAKHGKPFPVLLEAQTILCQFFATFSGGFVFFCHYRPDNPGPFSRPDPHHNPTTTGTDGSTRPGRDGYLFHPPPDPPSPAASPWPISRTARKAGFAPPENMPPLHGQSRCQTYMGTLLALTCIRSKHGMIRTALNWPAYHGLIQSVFSCRPHALHRAPCAPVPRPKEKAKA